MEELRNALAQTTEGGVSNLIPEDVEPLLREYLYKVSPLLQLVPKVRANGSTHEVVSRTDIPQAWVEGELTPPVFKSSSFGRKTVPLRITRIAGGVSNFAQAATADFIDLMEAEIDASVEAMAAALEFQIMWGSNSDPYQYDGIDSTLVENGGGELIDHDDVVTLALLDGMIDSIEQYRGVNRDQKIFLMSNQMVSKISGLETRVGMDLRTLQFEGGLRMSMYREIPMLTAPYVRPNSVSTSPTVVGTGATTDGTLAAGTYRYKISSVTLDGEQIAGGADDVTIAATGKVTLTFTADAYAKLYKVWRTADGGADDDDAYNLLATIPAKAYAADGSISANVVSFVDDGSFTANTSVHPLAAGEETIWLLDMNPVRGVSMVYLPNERGAPIGENNWIRFLPLARTKSSEDYLIEAFTSLQVPQPETNVVARRVSVTS